MAYHNPHANRSKLAEDEAYTPNEPYNPDWVLQQTSTDSGVIKLFNLELLEMFKIIKCQKTRDTVLERLVTALSQGHNNKCPEAPNRRALNALMSVLVEPWHFIIDGEQAFSFGDGSVEKDWSGISMLEESKKAARLHKRALELREQHTKSKDQSNSIEVAHRAIIWGVSDYKKSETTAVTTGALQHSASLSNPTSNEAKTADETYPQLQLSLRNRFANLNKQRLLEAFNRNPYGLFIRGLQIDKPDFNTHHNITMVWQMADAHFSYPGILGNESRSAFMRIFASIDFRDFPLDAVMGENIKTAQDNVRAEKMPVEVNEKIGKWEKYQWDLMNKGERLRYLDLGRSSADNTVSEAKKQDPEATRIQSEKESGSEDEEEGGVTL